MIDSNPSNVQSLEGKDSLIFVLRRIREALKISQEDFGRKIGVSGQTISRWETGKSIPTFTVSQFRRLLNAMKEVGMTIDDLPDETDAKSA